VKSSLSKQELLATRITTLCKSVVLFPSRLKIKKNPASVVPHVQTTTTAMPETTQETCAPAKDSPFFIKNLLNCDSKPSKPKPVLAATKAALEGGFSLSQVGDFNFPRFDLPAQRFSLPAHYLERTSAWWYPYTLSSAAHLHRTEGNTSSSDTLILMPMSDIYPNLSLKSLDVVNLTIHRNSNHILEPCAITATKTIELPSY